MGLFTPGKEGIKSAFGQDTGKIAKGLVEQVRQSKINPEDIGRGCQVFFMAGDFERYLELIGLPKDKLQSGIKKARRWQIGAFTTAGIIGVSSIGTFLSGFLPDATWPAANMFTGIALMPVAMAFAFNGAVGRYHWLVLKKEKWQDFERVMKADGNGLHIFAHLLKMRCQKDIEKSRSANDEVIDGKR